jgi:glycosyltransferase involved in cell wall biosynthesis
MRNNVPLLIVGYFLSETLKTRSVCEDLADHLRNSGWEVITTSSKKRRVPRLLDILNTIWSRRNEYELAQVDVYSGFAFRWAEAACLALRQAGKPYILTLHGGNLPEFARKQRKRVLKLLNSAAAVTSPSPYLYESLIDFRKDLILLPNPIDLNAFLFQLRSNPQPRLVWLRAFHEIYNPELAAKVVAILAPDIPDIQLTMGGPDKDGISLKKFKQTAQELKISERIQIPGAIARKDVGAFLNQGDIFLNTTNFDNTPVSVMEAMACGLCVISTNVGGIPKLLRANEDGLMVPPNDENAMAESVRRILKDPEFASKISSAARTKVENFDWPKILPKWESLFLSVSEQNPKHSTWKIPNASVVK